MNLNYEKMQKNYFSYPHCKKRLHKAASYTKMNMSKPKYN